MLKREDSEILMDFLTNIMLSKYHNIIIYIFRMKYFLKKGLVCETHDWKLAILDVLLQNGKVINYIRILSGHKKRGDGVEIVDKINETISRNQAKLDRTRNF